jgi:hypothetical protein
LTSTEAILSLSSPQSTQKKRMGVWAYGRMGEKSPTRPHPHTPTQAVVRMKLVGANPTARVTGAEELPGKVNYFIGNDPKK